MNVTYIIGNGFDLNLGLKTGYQDFYDYYIEVPSPNSHVELLKNTIKQDGYKLWSDLEVGLGKISAKYEKVEDFIAALEDVSDHLRKYITGINNGVQIEQYDADRFRSDLCNPSKYLVEADRFNLQSLYKANNSAWNVNIVSFNYTSVVQRLLNFNNSSSARIGTNTVQGTTQIRKIEHVHGDLDGTILVGVNDIEQIEKNTFRENIDLLEMFVKPRANDVIGKRLIDKCRTIINESHLICIFGHSMGPTDKIWWNLIKDNIVKRDCRLILFIYNKNIDVTHREYLRSRIKRQYIQKLGWAENMSQRIYIGLNTDIFNLKSKTSNEHVAL